jgi:hypothetical protein
MRHYMIPDVFELPDRKANAPRPWFAALAISAIIVGATLALVTVNEVPGDGLQVTFSL